MIEIKRLPEFDEWLDGIKDNISHILYFFITFDVINGF